jgi:hypothetical protein
MSISGNLETMEAAELLQWLAHGRKTGTLLISRAKVEKRIFFDKGTVIMTASSDPKEYLGHFLVSHGLIDEAVLAKAMEMQEQNRMLLGKILVTIGAISEEELGQMLRLKLEESVYEVFTWPKGEFHFLDGELPEFTMIPLSLNVNALILEGAKRVDDWRRIRQSISSNQIVPVAVGELVPPEGDSHAKTILGLVDDDRTIEEIALHSHATEFHVCRVLLEQAEARTVKLIRPREGKDSRSTLSETPEQIDSTSLLRSAKRYLEGENFEQALRHLRAALSLEPHNEDVQRVVAEAEGNIRHSLASEGFKPDAVPQLNHTVEELATLDISPQEGFILTRVNGTYDIQTILKISPMPPLEALLVFRRLKGNRHIRFD